MPCDLSAVFICTQYTFYDTLYLIYRQKETAPPAKKLPAVPESVLKRRKNREAVKAARLQISIKVFFFV